MFVKHHVPTKNPHAKNKGSISEGSKVMPNVKVVKWTDQLTDQRTDKAKTVCSRYATGDIKSILFLQMLTTFHDSSILFTVTQMNACSTEDHIIENRCYPIQHHQNGI